MKLNLPTTWTNQKMSSLFLLTLLHSLPKTKAGSQFSICLGTGTYDALVSFANNIPDKQRFCCSDCSFVCANMSPTCPLSDSQVCYANGGSELPAQCNRVGLSTFCVTTGYSVNSLPGKLCGGLLGNSIPTNAIAGTCPSFQAIMIVTTGQITNPSFSWLCCNNNSCVVPINVNVTNNIANTNCLAGQYSMMCFNDNGGWTCTGSISTAINDITQPIGDCVIQVIPNSPTSSLLSSSEPLTSFLSNSVLNKVTSLASATTLGSDRTFSPSSTKGANDDTSSNSLSKSDIIAIIFGILSLAVTVIGLFFGWKKHQQHQSDQQTIRNLQTELWAFDPQRN